MKRQTITFLLTLLMSMVGAKALAYDCMVDLLCYNLNRNNLTATVTYSGFPYNNYYRESGIFRGLDIVIPSTITYNDVEYTVTAIDHHAFWDAEGWVSMNSVTIPSSVTSIGSYAFYNCKYLISATIPSSVTYIGANAFYGSAWYNNLPDGLVYAGKVAYKYKGTMPSNTSVILQDGIVGITDYAFENCSGLVSITIPSSVTVIGTFAFSGCSGLTSVTIPEGVTSIGNSAFSCSGLTSVAIPSSVTSIDQSAFLGCSGLTSVIIPENVTSIGSYAFSGCSSLTSVTVEMETPVSINSSSTFSNRKNATLYVPYGCKVAYEAAEYWKEFKEIVEMPKPVVVTDISQLDNAIYIEPTEGRCGSQTTLSVKMKNDVAIQTIQFDLYLPDGITIVPNEDDELVTASKERINRFNYFESSMQSDGALRLLAQATTTNVPVGDGEICRIVVNIPESMEEGDYPLVIKGALMVENDNTNHSPDPNLVQTKLTVLNYVPGDASNDGDVNAIDFNMIGKHILGQTQEGFNVKAADISGDGDVNAIDFNMVGNMILNGSTASARERRMSTNMEKDNEPQ